MTIYEHVLKVTKDRRRAPTTTKNITAIEEIVSFFHILLTLFSSISSRCLLVFLCVCVAGCGLMMLVKNKYKIYS